MMRTTSLAFWAGFAITAAACGTSPGGDDADAVGDVAADVPTDADAATDTDVALDTSADVEDVDAGDDADDGDVSDADVGPRCDYADPRVGWVSQSVEQCMVVDFDCAEAYDPFSDECGCGCRIPTEGTCDSSRFTTSGIAEPFAIDAQCEFLVFCSSLDDPEALRALVPPIFDELTCTAQTDYACPDFSTGASCIMYIENVEYDEVVAVCETSSDSRFDGFVCAGDL